MERAAKSCNSLRQGWSAQEYRCHRPPLQSWGAARHFLNFVAVSMLPEWSAQTLRQTTQPLSSGMGQAIQRGKMDQTDARTQRSL